MSYYTVSQVGKFVTDIFNAEVMLHNILVYGEVSGFKISQNHAYFILKDDKASLQCSCFNYKKTYVPKDGETVIIKCSPNYYSKGGKLSFIVDYIEPQGKGDLYLKIEQLKKQLFEEGLFDEARKKPIPKYPQNVGVVTSKTGAVIQDILRTVRRKNKNLNLLLVDTKVQGVGAVEELIEGIGMLDKLNLDAIIVARGGGSIEDLMPFNDEKLARAVANANTPIISAVGHETDYTICDMVADIRCLTPTAAGELVAFSEQDLVYDINDTMKGMLSIIEDKFTDNIENIDDIINDISSSVNNKFVANTKILDLKLNSILGSINKKVLSKQNDYVVLNEKIKDIGNSINEKTSFKIYKDGKRQVDLSNINVGDNINIISNNVSVEASIFAKKVDYEK